MSGYCAMGRPDIATAPMSTIRMAMTIATIGLPMKKRAKASALRRGRGRGRGRDGVDDRSGPQPHQVRDDDLVRGAQALLDDPHRADLLRGLDRTQVELAFR